MMGSLWDKLFSRDEPNQIREERLHAIRLIERKKSATAAIALMEENVRLILRETAFIRGGGAVSAAFTLVDSVSMLCLKAGLDGGLDMEGWPSECANINLTDIMMFKPRIEEMLGRKLTVMRVSDYYYAFEQGAEDKVQYCTSVLRELSQLGEK